MCPPSITSSIRGRGWRDVPQGSLCSGQQRAALRASQTPARNGWGAREQELPQRAALGVMRRGELIHIQGPPRLISFFYSKSASLNGAILVTEGYLFSCSPPHGFPSPSHFSPSLNYLCPILTMQLVKTMTEIFPDQPNSDSCTSDLSRGRFAVLRHSYTSSRL